MEVACVCVIEGEVRVYVYANKKYANIMFIY